MTLGPGPQTALPEELGCSAWLPASGTQSPTGAHVRCPQRAGTLAGRGSVSAACGNSGTGGRRACLGTPNPPALVPSSDLSGPAASSCGLCFHRGRRGRCWGDAGRRGGLGDRAAPTAESSAARSARGSADRALRPASRVRGPPRGGGGGGGRPPGASCSQGCSQDPLVLSCPKRAPPPTTRHRTCHPNSLQRTRRPELSFPTLTEETQRLHNEVTS